MSKKVILISGKARSGKDTLAKVLGDYLKEQGKDVLITHYADSLKYICETVFKWDGKKDEKGLDSLFSAGGTNITSNSFTGSEDFEIVSYLVIR